MAIHIDAGEAAAHLSDYLDRAINRGERIIVERAGEPVAALVPLDDLRRLESPAPTSPSEEGEAERQDWFRQSMAEAGLVTRWPAKERAPLSERRPIQVPGQPLSEQIVEDRH